MPSEASSATLAADLERVLKLEVPLIVEIAARQMRVEDVMSMTPGAIIELPKRAEDELDILVNNKTIGQGRAVKVGENFGIRVSYVGDLSQRVQALGGATAQPTVTASPDNGAPDSADDGNQNGTSAKSAADDGQAAAPADSPDGPAQ